MIVTELRNAVVETIEFIIPPIVKLSIIIILANFVTHGYFMLFLSGAINNQYRTLDITEIKAAIDGLYLSGVIPIVAILLLITLAYIVTRSTTFIGSIVPIYYHTISVLRNKYSTIEIWLFFPEIQTINELDIKIKHLYSLAQATNSMLPFDQMKWLEEKRIRIFQNITFTKFIGIWCIACYFVIMKYYSVPLQSSRLLGTLVILIILIIAYYFQISKNELDIENTRLMIVSNFLKVDSNYSTKKNTSTTVRQDLEEKFDLVSSHDKKWWWLSIGYKTDWLMMYKYYRLRPPLYKFYEKWRRERIVNKRTDLK